MAKFDVEEIYELLEMNEPQKALALLKKVRTKDAQAWFLQGEAERQSGHFETALLTEEPVNRGCPHFRQIGSPIKLILAKHSSQSPFSPLNILPHNKQRGGRRIFIIFCSQANIKL